MLVLHRKDGSRGEIRVVLQEFDRVDLLLNGLRWVCINDAINSFNKDSEVNDLYLTATYAGDLRSEVLEKYINAANAEKIVNTSKSENSDKQKVHSDGSCEENEDEEEESEELDSKEAIKEILSDTDLTCHKCGDPDKALVDKEGNIHDCESCIKIDAYLKGKKEGFEAGYDKGYQDAMKALAKICDNLDQSKIEEVSNRKENEDESEQH